MSWNHRILAHKSHRRVYFSIHEVYYDTKGKPDAYTSNAITVEGDSIESIEWTLKKMKKCLKKPILWGGVKFPKKYSL